MRPTCITGWLMLATVALTGCGTLNNVIVGTPAAPPHIYTPPLEVYGGVRSDIRDAVSAVTPPYDETPGENARRAATAVLVIADIPLSAVGDTLTLGRTIPASIDARQEALEPSHPGVPTPFRPLGPDAHGPGETDEQDDQNRAQS